MSFAILNEGVRLLPAFCKPYTDELLSSWITRMAFKHGLSTSEFCKLIWPAYNAHPDVDRYISDHRIRQLAEQTNCSFEEVKATTLWSFEKAIFEKMHPIQPMENWLIPCKNAQLSISRQLYSTGLMFCPKCVKNKMYFKKQWRLAVSFVCVDCGCYLFESCPHCKKGNSFMEKITYDITQYTVAEHLVNCHYCSKNVTLCEPEMAPVSFVKLQQRLYDIIDCGHYQEEINSSSYFSVLYCLASSLLMDKDTKKKFRNFIIDVFARNNLSPIALHPFTIKQVHDLPVQKRALVIKLSYWLLDGWPYRLVSLFIKHKIYSSDILMDFKNAPFWFASPIIDGLHCLHEKIDEAELREFEEDAPDEEYVPKKKGKCLKKLTYDLDFDNYFYAADDYEDNINEHAERYLYEMSLCNNYIYN